MKKKKLDIIYEDKNIIVINKPSKLLTIKDNSYSNSLYEMVRTYLKQKNKHNKVFIVHRLDKDTSGLIVFAKNIESKIYLQENWNKTVIRNYQAICINNFKKDSGKIISYLKETKTFYTYSSKDNKGLYAHTDYYVIQKFKKYALVNINIQTGRKNQIRVHLNDINCSIVGDKKYGNIKAEYLMLNANYLKFSHPKTKKIMEFQINNPKYFLKYFI